MVPIFLSNFLDHLTQRPLYLFRLRSIKNKLMVIFSPPLTTVPFIFYIMFLAKTLVTLGFCFDFWTYLLSKKLWMIVPSASLHTFLPMPKYLFVGKICSVMERKGTWAKRKLAKTEDLLPTYLLKNVLYLKDWEWGIHSSRILSR